MGNGTSNPDAPYASTTAGRIKTAKDVFSATLLSDGSPQNPWKYPSRERSGKVLPTTGWRRKQAAASGDQG